MEDYLAHHGIVGMKWGVRRYQNPDGSLTLAGRRRYNSVERVYDANSKRDKARETYLKKSEKGFGFTTDKDIARARAKYVSEDKKANKALKKYTKQIQKDIEESQREDHINGGNHNNYLEVSKRLNAEISGSEEHKKVLKLYDRYNKLNYDLSQKLHEKGITAETINDAKRIDKVYENYQKARTAYTKKGQEIINSFRGDVLGAKLKDLGHKDTEVGRTILNNIIEKEKYDWWSAYYDKHNK